MLLDAVESNDVVLCDRYAASNTAHQAAKLASEDRSELIRRIETVEHDVYGLPRPERTVLLDLSVENARRLIATKAKRVYTDETEDLHESDGIYLYAVREVYRSLAEGNPSWRTVACERDGAVRAVDEIASDVFEAVA